MNIRKFESLYGSGTSLDIVSNFEFRASDFRFRGLLYETKTWLTKAHNRKLVTDEEFDSLQKEINTIGIKLNNYINSIGKQKSQHQKVNVPNDTQ